MKNIAYTKKFIITIVFLVGLFSGFFVTYVVKDPDFKKSLKAAVVKAAFPTRTANYTSDWTMTKCRIVQNLNSNANYGNTYIYLGPAEWEVNTATNGHTVIERWSVSEWKDSQVEGDQRYWNQNGTSASFQTQPISSSSCNLTKWNNPSGGNVVHANSAGLYGFLVTYTPGNSHWHSRTGFSMPKKWHVEGWVD